MLLQCKEMCLYPPKCLVLITLEQTYNATGFYLLKWILRTYSEHIQPNIFGNAHVDLRVYLSQKNPQHYADTEDTDYRERRCSGDVLELMPFINNNMDFMYDFEFWSDFSRNHLRGFVVSHQVAVWNFGLFCWTPVSTPKKKKSMKINMTMRASILLFDTSKCRKYKKNSYFAAVRC